MLRSSKHGKYPDNGAPELKYPHYRCIVSTNGRKKRNLDKNRVLKAISRDKQ